MGWYVWVIHFDRFCRRRNDVSIEVPFFDLVCHYNPNISPNIVLFNVESKIVRLLRLRTFLLVYRKLLKIHQHAHIKAAGYFLKPAFVIIKWDLIMCETEFA